VGSGPRSVRVYEQTFRRAACAFAVAMVLVMVAIAGGSRGMTNLVLADEDDPDFVVLELKTAEACG
jgi:hypothetical protein